MLIHAGGECSRCNISLVGLLEPEVNCTCMKCNHEEKVCPKCKPKGCSKCKGKLESSFERAEKIGLIF